MKKQTAVEFLIKAFQGAYGDKVINVVSVQVEQAKQMEKQQIIDAHDMGYIDGGNHKKVTAEMYYNETYGSKEIDKKEQKKLITEIMNEDAKDGLYNTSSQTELSDEEIFYQKQVMNPYSTGEQSYTAYEKGFMDFAKWYREQLKSRQC